jgi:DMSO/TMAO reductase YedYZ molybdopterin-dependent catalytic subunit
MDPAERAEHMAIFSPGFRGRKRTENPALPPGQYEEHGFPVLSAGATPKIREDDWQLSLTTETGGTKTWSWADMMALGPEPIDTDLHCVTSWSKFGTHWRGVSLDKLLDGVDTTAGYLWVGCYGGYTTNLPLEDVRGGKAWIAFEYDGERLRPEHGGPARLLVPHLYLWKSAKWVNSLTLMEHDKAGFWESLGYHMHGDPWTEERYRSA